VHFLKFLFFCIQSLGNQCAQKNQVKIAAAPTERAVLPCSLATAAAAAAADTRDITERYGPYGFTREKVTVQYVRWPISHSAGLLQLLYTDTGGDAGVSW